MRPGILNPTPFLSGSEFEVDGVISSEEFRTSIQTRGRFTAISER